MILVKALLNNIEARVYFFVAGLVLSFLGLISPAACLKVLKSWNQK